MNIGVDRKGCHWSEEQEGFQLLLDTLTETRWIRFSEPSAGSKQGEKGKYVWSGCETHGF